jgi:hypothetical protein
MESDKKLIESWDDVRNRFNDLLKRPINRYAWHQDILQRYKDGRLSVHIHGVGADGEAFCVMSHHPVYAQTGDISTSQSDPVVLINNLDALRGGAGRDRHAINATHTQQGHPMLVCVYKMVQPPQRIVGGSVRLRRLDRANNQCWDVSGIGSREVLRKTFKTVLVPVLAGNVDGKVDDSAQLPWRRDGIIGWHEVLARDLKDYVIKRRTRIDNDIADQDAESKRGINDVQPTSAIGLVVSAEHVGVFIKVHGDLGLQSVQVFLSPDDFEPRAIERVHH